MNKISVSEFYNTISVVIEDTAAVSDEIEKVFNNTHDREIEVNTAAVSDEIEVTFSGINVRTTNDGVYVTDEIETTKT